MKNTFKLICQRFLVILHDICMIPLAWGLAYFFRFNLSPIPEYAFRNYELILIPAILVQTASFFFFGLYRGVWRFASLPDLVRIFKSVFVSSVVIIVLIYAIGHRIFVPRSIMPLYSMFLVLLLSGDRLLYRYIKQFFLLGRTGKRVLIVGAGYAAESLVRDLLRHYKEWNPICFVDDDSRKQHQEIHGIRVIGSTSEIPKLVKEHDIEQILIAIPSATSLQMQKIVELCRKAQVSFQTLPGLNALSDGRISIQDLREVSIEDLLGRDPVQFDFSACLHDFKNKIILVTGGGGSIGSELCRQLALLGPKKLVIVDHAEFNLYSIDHELARRHSGLHLVSCLLDITNQEEIDRLFDDIRPDIVFHAAAYKHVPLLEPQPKTALRNNVFGTTILASAAVKYNAERFVLISTDKAVNPTNVMGATKRLAEVVCQQFQQRSDTKFIVVRFGNVLGSVGSVIPLFKAQLQQGGPLTVTHPDIVRYFMTIPEASCLIIQACSLGKGGETFVLDMGEPIKITALAEQLIRLAGKEPQKEIEIVYTGLRPGEKMYEELFYGEENAEKTEYTKILRAKPCKNESLCSLSQTCSMLQDVLSNDLVNYVHTLCRGHLEE